MKKGVEQWRILELNERKYTYEDEVNFFGEDIDERPFFSKERMRKEIKHVLDQDFDLTKQQYQAFLKRYLSDLPPTIYVYDELQYRGITESDNGSWKVQLKMRGRNKYFGTFDNKYEAAQEYNELIYNRDGENSKLNIVPGQYKTHV